MNPQVSIRKDQLTAFCKRWRIVELALFGSVLREDFGPDSDIDVLVHFDSQARHTLLDIAQMENELSRMLGREVDLIERTAVEQSRNYIRRKSILNSAETIYAA